MTLLTACHGDEPEPTPPDPSPITLPAPMPKAEKVVLIYAVASNNLSNYLDDDKTEIKLGASDVNLNKTRLLIYSVQYDYQKSERKTPTLSYLVKTSFGYDYKVLKEYDKAVASTDVSRIREVIKDATYVAPADEYSMVFWSHSDAWCPSANWTDTDDTKQYCFGADSDAGETRYCETADLASAIPDGLLNFIWFDSCYMSNIESMYEFRNKCRYFIGSATELVGIGQPYDRTLKWLLTGDVVKAAQVESDYFQSDGKPFTMCIADMSKFQPVIETTRDLYTDFEPLKNIGSLQRYDGERMKFPLCDFGQYTREVAKQASKDYSAFSAALDDFVIYSSHSYTDFVGRYIRDENYSGISCHLYDGTDTRANRMYHTLGWFNDIYPQK